MKQPCGIGVGGFLAALLLAACGGVAPNSSVNPLGGAAPQGGIGVPSTTAEATPRLCPERFTLPQRPRPSRLASHFKLHDNLQRWSSYRNRCFRHVRESAVWSSSGGSLQPNPKGKSAVFSASSPGLYTVVAKYAGLEGQATVTVTSL